MRCEGLFLIWKLSANSKALVLPMQWYERFPMGIVEAFSVGTQVVCSDFGNVGSIVEKGVTGSKGKMNSIKNVVKTIKRCSGMCDNAFSEYKKYTNVRNYEMINRIYIYVSSGENRVRRYSQDFIIYVLETCNIKRKVAA